MTTPFIERYIEEFNKLNAGKDRGVVLLARLGDFFEAYYSAAQILGHAGASVAHRYGIPCAGIPYHATGKYTDKILDMGYEVCLMESDGTKTFLRRVQ